MGFLVSAILMGNVPEVAVLLRTIEREKPTRLKFQLGPVEPDWAVLFQLDHLN